MRPLSLQSGLTLVEMLVAITVLSLVTVLGWRGLDSITRTRERLNTELEQTRRLQLTFAQLENDCRHVLNTPTSAVTSVIVIEQTQLTLVRSLVDEDRPTGMQLVRYRLLDGVLTRETSPSTRSFNELEQYRLALAGHSAEATPVTLLASVVNIKVRLWDGQKWLSATESSVSQRQVQGAAAAGVRAEKSGIEVALTLTNNPAALSKIFVLGAV